MDNFNLYPLILRFKERIEDILEAYLLCSSYTSDPDLPQRFKDEGLRWLPWYREALILEVELVKTILLEMMEAEEGASCPE